MNTDTLTTILGFVATTSAVSIELFPIESAKPWLGLLAAVSGAAFSYFTNKSDNKTTYRIDNENRN